MRSFILLFSASVIMAASAFKGKDLVVTSAAFSNNSIIPIKYSCEGDEVNPPLHIADMPAGTKSLALIVHDPDAPTPGGFTHWVMWNINISGEIPENYKEATQGVNSGKKTGYAGMCPPTGTHHYHFMVYALDKMLSLGASTDKAALENAMKGHVLAQTDLVGLYKKVK